MWSQSKEIAPTGYILIDNKLTPVTDLIYYGYSNFTVHMTDIARNMVIKEYELHHQPDGQVFYDRIYDVYDFQPGPHCLNVFGAKMIKDFLNEGDKQNEVRFNYTGIQ